MMEQDTLEGMIATLDRKEKIEVKMFIMSLISQRKEKKQPGAKKNALKMLRKHRGLLGGEDRESLLEEALEEKYGHIS